MALLAFLITPCLQAQVIFQETAISTGTNIGYAVKAMPGGFMVAGATSVNGNADVLLMKFDLSGNAAWAKTIGGMEEEVARSIKQTADGGFIIAGHTYSFLTPSANSDFYIIKTDALGDVLWMRTIGFTGEEKASDVIETNDNNYVITGTTTSLGAGGTDIYTVKLDATGNLLWSYVYGGAGNDIANSVVETSAGNLVIAGSTTGFSAGGRIPLIMTTNVSGVLNNPVYTFNPNTFTVKNSFFTHIIRGSAGELLVTGSDGTGGIGDAQHFILSLDESIGVNWMKKYFYNSGPGQGLSIVKTSEGGIAVAGIMGTDKPTLLKTDAAGNRQYNRFYTAVGTGILGQGRGIDITADGGIIMTGFWYNSDTSVYLVKTDYSLNSSCDQFFGMNEDEVMNPTRISQTASATDTMPSVLNNRGSMTLFTPFVNPICSGMGTPTAVAEQNSTWQAVSTSLESGKLHFSTNDDTDRVMGITLFSPAGNIVVQSANESAIAVNGIAKGMYIFQVQTIKNKVHSGKIIVP